MQVLYAMSRDESLDSRKAMFNYRQKISQSYELYLFALRYMIHIAKYSRNDAAKKKAKLRPTDFDKSFSPRLIDNPLMDSLAKNEGVLQLFRLHKLEDKIDEDTVRLVYTGFAQKEDYKTYATQKEVADQEHRNILLTLLKECIANESFVEALEDHYPNWLDDKSLVVGAVKKNFKALPLASNFYEEYRPSTETTVEFGEALIQKVQEEDEQLLSIIQPILKNWDADRVAIIDMILLKMAVCELLFFKSIPTKVTLNEFVEISKMYSTDKSKDFINGILDRLLKQLSTEGKINKEGRGLID